MSDHCEEQEMEAEALAAIFDIAFEVKSAQQPFSWAVRLVPVDCGGDEEEEAKQNHVAVKVLASIPLDYPESLPELDIEILKGLAEDQRKELLELAEAEAEANEGMPAIFAVCEAVRAWLGDNNEKGLDDGSMHAQMMRKKKEEKRSKEKKEQQFEAQKIEEEMTQAELEEIAVRKRRAEGTPCTEENFLAWKAKYEEEMEQKAEEEAEQDEKEGAGKKKADRKKDEMADRPTGYELFSGKAGVMNLEALEEELDDVEDDDGVEVDELDVDEDLFDDDDDLDDLDFDDSDDEDPEI
eukprot:CAMPEP_0183291846 /NCGR_PEP_ID=MMETSP0160_2-20130417/1121_1 /TAXON_ID=2839 ORGANISM="Odontella Sinensis, Strain Grunow 1884" /NCGR_SAMPLE_ID=MMETSP0160_2 /ASSEMBLY_ACC=CAM_ASM_000250 /LENGTH=295 /DNA_ID=CAMNT_0025452705 /DNA_START=76 /DNA_END=963 /DNA_ORIENTATION=+